MIKLISYRRLQNFLTISKYLNKRERKKKPKKKKGKEKKRRKMLAANSNHQHPLSSTSS